MHTKLRHRSPAYAQYRLGTAFGTARFIWLSLNADDASIFWRVGPIHHGRNGKVIIFIFQQVTLHYQGTRRGTHTLCVHSKLAKIVPVSTAFDLAVHT
jgi:hypothetical protein